MRRIEHWVAVGAVGRAPLRAGHRGGFTLLEGLIACVVLAILVLGIVGSLTASYQESESVRANGVGVTLARQLIDEMNSKPLADPSTGSETLGTETGTRSSYTHITSYNDYSDSSTALPLLEGGSLDVTGSDVYSREVSVAVGAKPSIDTESPATDFAIVTVTVRGPGGQVVSIPEFVAKYSVNP